MMEDQLNKVEAEKQACPSCGRGFIPESFSKHVKICKKVFVNKRKAFNSQKHRVIDSEHASLLKRKEMDDKKFKGKVGQGMGLVDKKKGKWKKQSEEFRAIMKANRQMGNNMSNVGSYGRFASKYICLIFKILTPISMEEDKQKCQIKVI
jgi:hypothetical protein